MRKLCKLDEVNSDISNDTRNLWLISWYKYCHVSYLFLFLRLKVTIFTNILIWEGIISTWTFVLKMILLSKPWFLRRFSWWKQNGRKYHRNRIIGRKYHREKSLWELNIANHSHRFNVPFIRCLDELLFTLVWTHALSTVKQVLLNRNVTIVTILSVGYNKLLQLE